MLTSHGRTVTSGRSDGSDLQRPHGSRGQHALHSRLRQALERERRMVFAQMADYLAIHAATGVTCGEDKDVEEPTVWSVHAQALQRILEEIEDALARMDAGTYGFCERCGQQIPLKRQQLAPCARWCVACVRPGRTTRAA